MLPVLIEMAVNQCYLVAVQQQNTEEEDQMILILMTSGTQISEYWSFVNQVASNTDPNR